MDIRKVVTAEWMEYMEAQLEAHPDGTNDLFLELAALGNLPDGVDENDAKVKELLVKLQEAHS